MIKIDIGPALAKLEKEMSIFSRDLQQRAIVTAINKTAASAKVEASRDIRGAGYNISAKGVKDSITVYKATGANLSATVVATGKAIPRVAFAARQTAKGVSYSIKGGRVVKPGAFIATMKSGHRGMFVRKPGMQMGKKGKPILNRKIIELWGPSVPTALMTSAVRMRLEAALRMRFPKELERALRGLLYRQK